MNKRAAVGSLVAMLIASLLAFAGSANAQPADVSRVAVIGDSITACYGVPSGYCWADWFENAQSGDNLATYGVNGATTRRWLQQYLPQLNTLPAWHPNTVVIALGGNEYRQTRPVVEYADHLRQLIQYVHTITPDARIVLLHYYRILAEFEPNGCDAPPGDNTPCMHANPPDSWDAYGSTMQRTAQANGVLFADISHARNWDLLISADQAHLTALGHYYYAGDFRVALSRLP